MTEGECIDCRVNTTPRRGPSEFYMVKNWVWDRTGLGFDGGMLCIGCLESRLGRRLRPQDFNRVTFREIARHSARLRSRLGCPQGAEGHADAIQPKITRPAPSNRKPRKTPKNTVLFSIPCEGGFSTPCEILGRGYRWPRLKAKPAAPPKMKARTIAGPVDKYSARSLRAACLPLDPETAARVNASNDWDRIRKETAWSKPRPPAPQEMQSDWKPCSASVPVADDLSIPDFLKREPAAASESPEGFLEAAE
jgi:hypothetical protein